MAVYYRKDRDDWAIDVIDEWGRRRRRFVKSEQAARALEANLRHAIAQARAQIKRAAIPEMKLSDAVQMFLTNLAATPTTRGHNAQRLAALTRVIGDPQIHDVTPALLADYQARRREQVSQATLAYEAQVIFRLFRYLVEHGYITVNPAASLDRKEPRTSPGKELTYEEERKILLACTPRVRLRLLLGLDAGLRRGEIMGLRRRDWQKQEALITVWRPKTRTSTTIPLTQRLSLALEEIAGHLMPDSFINSWGNEQVRKGTDALKNLRARTAVPFRLHDTRHTFATRLRRVAPFEVVRHLMGHAPSTVTERYIHPSIEDCRRAIEKMEQKNPNKSLPLA